MTPTRRITIAIPIVTGAGSPNPTLCDFECIGLVTIGPFCRIFTLPDDTWRNLRVTDPDGHPTRCRQCRRAEVK